MKARFTGDPRYRDNPAKAGDPDRIVYHGKEFPKGQWVTIDDKKDERWLEQHGDKLRNNGHFEVDNEPAQPGMEPYKEDPAYKKQKAEEEKLRAEREEREEQIPGHRPDSGPTKDIGQENPAGPPAAGPEAEAMTRGFGSVDSPTDSPSRNPHKRANLMREREAALPETTTKQSKK